MKCPLCQTEMHFDSWGDVMFDQFTDSHLQAYHGLDLNVVGVRTADDLILLLVLGANLHRQSP